MVGGSAVVLAWGVLLLATIGVQSLDKTELSEAKALAPDADNTAKAANETTVGTTVGTTEGIAGVTTVGTTSGTTEGATGGTTINAAVATTTDPPQSEGTEAKCTSSNEKKPPEGCYAGSLLFERVVILVTKNESNTKIPDMIKVRGTGPSNIDCSHPFTFKAPKFELANVTDCLPWFVSFHELKYCADENWMLLNLTFMSFQREVDLHPADCPTEITQEAPKTTSSFARREPRTSSGNIGEVQILASGSIKGLRH